MSGLQALRQLLRESHHARPEDLPDMVRRAAPLLGVDALIIYLVDYQQLVLLPLTGAFTPPREELPVDGTMAGRAFSTGAVLEVAADAETKLWMPLLDGTERLGVLEILRDGSLSEQAREDCVTAAALVAEMVITRNLYGDTIERIRRRSPMRLPAELVRTQLPPLSFSTGRLVISGILEPCYDVGGDAFDYAVNGDIAHLALFDAVGHGSNGGMRAAVLASIAMAAYRNARRSGMSLTDTYHHIDVAVRTHDRVGMITAVLVELDQHTGALRAISAGHPGGLVLRDGRMVKVLPTPTALPVTLGDLRPPVVVQEALEPGDQLLLYTDGIVEARSADGVPFGMDRLIDFAARAVADRLPAPETTRRLVHAILEYQNDELQDDATVLLAQWLG